jgi:hypothetical protein
MSIRALLVCIAALFFAAVTVYVEGPGLMRDFGLRNAALVPAPDLRVEEARCTSHWWVLSNCTISYRAPQAQQRYSLSFSVLGTIGGERFQLMRSPDNRTVTTDIAVAKLTNRVTAMVVLLALFSMIGFFAFRRALA